MEHKKRVYWIDLLRGITIISMVLYHATWDMVYIFHTRFSWFDAIWGNLWQLSICITFIMLAGFSFHFDRHPLKRGLLVFVCGWIIFVFTSIFMPEDRILFGILTFLGFSIVILSFIERIVVKIPSYIGIFGSILGFFLLQNIDHTYLGIEGIYTIKLPSFLYQYRVLSFFGFPDPMFKSSDYFPFFPWFFIFLIGYYVYFLWDEQQKKYDFKSSFLPGLQWIGKKSLLIYMLHQPIIYVFLYFIYKI